MARRRSDVDPTYDCDCCGFPTPLCCITRTKFAGMDTSACVTCVGGDMDEEHKDHEESDA